MSSEPGSDDQSLPVNLHFPDERALSVDIDAVMRRGLRMRRNRKALAGAVAAVTVGVLGVSAAYLAPSSAPSAPAVSTGGSPTGFEQSSVFREHPPAGGRFAVLSSRPNPMAGFTQSVVAWLSGGQSCFGAVDLASTRNSSITCESRLSGRSGSKPTVLAPQPVAGVTDDMGSQVVVGFVVGAVAKVSLKINGHLYDAVVVALPGSPSIGAYAVWALPGYGVVTGRDFTQITGYDSQGAVVAQEEP